MAVSADASRKGLHVSYSATDWFTSLLVCLECRALTSQRRAAYLCPDCGAAYPITRTCLFSRGAAHTRCS